MEKKFFTIVQYCSVWIFSQKHSNISKNTEADKKKQRGARYSMHKPTFEDKETTLIQAASANRGNEDQEEHHVQQLSWTPVTKPTNMSISPIGDKTSEATSSTEVAPTCETMRI